MTTDPASLPASRGFNDDVSQISFTNFIDAHTHKNLWIVNKICTIFLSHINWWLRMRNARCAMRVCVCFASIYDNSCRLLFIANWKISWEFPSLHLFFPGKSKRNFSSCFRTNKFHLMICYIHLTYVGTYIYANDCFQIVTYYCQSPSSSIIDPNENMLAVLNLMKSSFNMYYYLLWLFSLFVQPKRGAANPPRRHVARKRRK